MTLSAGTKLGPYEILSPLGAGGMGEVYRAQDTRLERTVAVKVLTSHLSSSAELRQRFEREAKTISRLSHPHICALYDVGQADGVEYLVMEYLEGETLTQRLARGPLPPEQVLRYGVEMAEALDQAHRQGIVHRDLKPGNVMVSKSGVKLLDFGLAKVVAPVTPASGVTSLPTMQGSPDLTQGGTILGTFQYMAPEQLEGKDADPRTDIFALGAVLYEMATGRKAFAGKSQASLIGSILKDEPPAISAVQPMVPPALDRVVRTCLAKDPEDRWQSAHDIAAELKWISEGSQAGIAAPATVSTRRRSRERIAWAGFALATLAAIALGVGYLRRAPAAARATRFEIVPSDVAPFRTLSNAVATMIALSPDGRLLAFEAEDSKGKRSLWIRALDGLEARPLPGTEDAWYPFWSPDSRSIGFFANKKLKRVDASGGPVQDVCDAVDGRGGAWNRDGVILLAPSATSPLHRVAASGGVPVPAIPLDAAHGEDSQRWPTFLPDGKHFLYFSYLGANPEARNQNGGIRVGRLDSKETRAVVPQASNVAYSEPGELLFSRGGNLLAQRFDSKVLQVVGEAVPVAQGVVVDDAKKLAFFSASSTGVLAYARDKAFPARLLWLDRQGRQIGSVGESGDYRFPRLSPDGRKLSIAVAQGPRTSLWIYDLNRGSSTRFSGDTAYDDGPAIWSPDGTRLAFGSARGGPQRLFVRPVGGTGSEQALLKTADAEIPVDWSHDGRFIAFDAPGGTTDWDIWILPLEGDRKPFPFRQSPAADVGPSFSPDGKWIAFTAVESGKSDVLAAPFPGPGDPVPISTAGGRDAKWRGDGKELFYIAEDGKMMAVPIREGATLEPGVPAALFDARTRVQPGFRFDVSPDGQRFLVVTRGSDVEFSPIAVVVNWMEGLKRP
ncbi:MAG TPA: protein kinase [Thermoanaerobaculia bacterium]|nr:protein kinase [Thermoanaerobaculia bacterium]